MVHAVAGKTLGYEPAVAAREHVFRARVRVQCNIKVLIRLGTSPTGITAVSFKVFVSMEDTERPPEFEI